MLLQINNLHKDFKRGKETVHVLNDLSISVEKGEFLALMGPSGSGKSTLLNMIGGIDRPTSGDRKQRALAALDLVGLSDRTTHKPGEMSGGQEQRVGIARAIVTDPDLLLCDEPTGDLDRKSGDEILDLLQALNEQQGKTIIMVTHDLRAAERAKKILYMEDGKISTTRNI